LGIGGRLFLSPVAGVLIFLAGIYLLYYAIKLYQIKTKAMARKLMLVSVIYITLLQLIYVADKFLR
jgi:protoheme IX farnesyltransferase